MMKNFEKKLPIIQALWIGDKLSQIEQSSILSFLKQGHQFHLYTYQDLQNVPQNAVIKDANKIIPKKYIFTYAHNNSYAGFADWFRWKLLYQKGNFYVDLDVICLKPFSFQEQLIFGWQDGGIICPAVLGFPPKHKICKYLLLRSERPHIIRIIGIWNILKNKSLKQKFSKLLIFKILKLFISKTKLRKLQYWGELGGPPAFTDTLKEFNLLHLAKAPYYFYPIDWKHSHTVFDNTYVKTQAPIEKSYAIHLWNFALELKMIKKDNSFPEKSLFEQLKKNIEEI